MKPAVIVSMLLALVAVLAHAQPAATRGVQSLQQAETTLLQAIHDNDTAGNERLLDADFEMHVAQQPGIPVVREDWVRSAVRPNAGVWRIQQLAVHDLGQVAVGSFLLEPLGGPAKRTAVFIVDTWRHDKEGWRLLVRHAAPVCGDRQSMPGDAMSPTQRKKI